ncbi:HET-domain-containing protein, partial [Colletotrichum asianum]
SHEISDHNYYATGRAYTFNISYGEALEQAQAGCELFAWLVTLRRPDTWDESWLRAYYTSPPEVHMVLDWVNDLDDHVDGGDPSRQVVVCAEEGVVESSQPLQPSYVALSYCWGGDQRVKLRQVNMDKWRKGLPYEGLPQTIKDAITVTMNFGVSHLWVDALCIIQDSDDDKAQEISRMGDIYEQAHFTIIAARAKMVEEGFLHSRSIAGERGFRISYVSGNGDLGSVVFWTGRGNSEPEPTETRAWCFQESILSSRVLYFGTHNSKWICAETRKQNSEPLYDGWIEDSRLNLESVNNSRHLVYGVEWTTMSDSEAFYSGWRDLLQYYSVMEAGQQQDRLLAISAVAKKIGRIAKNRYSAGIWMNSPSDSLAWVSSSDKAKRLTSYYIPSWSWASISGEIGLESCTPMEEFSIQHCQLKSQIPGDDFSAPIEAQMKLQALTFPAHVRRDEELGQDFLWDLAAGEAVDGQLSLDIAIDRPEREILYGEELLVAYIDVRVALVLKWCSDKLTFRRIGICIRMPNREETGELKEVTVT